MTERKTERTPRLLNPYTGPESGAQDFGDDYGVPSHEGNRVLTPEEIAEMDRNAPAEGCGESYTPLAQPGSHAIDPEVRAGGADDVHSGS